MSANSSRRYPPELRERAVRMVAEISGQHDSEWSAISEVARLLGVGQAPAPAGDEAILVESKVIQLPVTPQPPPAEFGAPEDPNTFPG